MHATTQVPWEAARSHLTLAPFCDGHSQVYMASVQRLCGALMSMMPDNNAHEPQK